MSENLTTETQALIDAAFKRYAAQLKKESRRLFGSAQRQHEELENFIESLSPPYVSDSPGCDYWRRCHGGSIDG